MSAFDPKRTLGRAARSSTTAAGVVSDNLVGWKLTASIAPTSEATRFG